MKRYLSHPLFFPVLLATVALSPAEPHAGQTLAPQASAAAGMTLAPTEHPPLPRGIDQLWMAPGEAHRARTAALRSFGTGVRLHAEARYAEALPLVRTPLAGPLAEYGRYYAALTELRLGRPAAAREALLAIAARAPQGYLSVASRLRAAEAAVELKDHAGAMAIYRELSELKTIAPEDVLFRLGQAASDAGDRAAAASAWMRVYFEFPFSDQAALAGAQLESQKLWEPLQREGRRFALELGRAERLFGGRRYAEARAAFERLAPFADGDEAEIVALRLAESDHYLKRYAQAVRALEPWTRKARRRAEARFFYLTATRAMGNRAEFVRLTRELVEEWPQDSWAEEALNNLATHYILVDEDGAAIQTFREILERFPDGTHAPRAAWRAGWWAYRHGDFATTVRLFEDAAGRFPRSDYRPSWLYWAGRAHERLGATGAATARHALVVTDYRNSYYGRLAAERLRARGATVPSTPSVLRTPEPAQPLPPTESLIRALIAHELYDDALNEVLYAQKMWGDSPAVQATLALVHARRGDLRRGINAMKRAYPQYIAAGGEQLPEEMLKVLFPVGYWDLLRRYGAAHGLDPYVLAALTAQESTFDPAARSPANAIGLMQILPSTGRQYARRLGIRRLPAAQLTRPELNVRLGTAIFADLIERTGGLHYALASYNAGEGAVKRWRAERPELPADEFIDDIPYPETQNYVKKILGTAEDYRQLYGTAAAPAGTVKRAVTAPRVKAPPKAKTPPARKRKKTS